MKIAILKNKGVKKRFVEKEIKNLKYFSKINKNFKLHNIPFSVTELDTDFKVEVSVKGVASNGKKGYTLKSIPEIPEGYDFVAIMYDGVPIFKRNEGNFAYSRKDPINGAFITEIPDSSNDHVLPHELIHLIGYKLKSMGYPVVDQMDTTRVSGKNIPYYKNDEPEAQLGNYHVTLISFNPFIKYLNQKITIPAIISNIVNQVKCKVISDKPKYRNFSELEVNGLQHDFVLLLDKARDNAGIPFVINSGFRSVAHNRKVGGVANSSHISGLAADIRARNGSEAYAIIKAAIEVGITRIGINRAKQFIHLDNDLSKPNPTIYEY